VPGNDPASSSNYSARRRPYYYCRRRPYYYRRLGLGAKALCVGRIRMLAASPVRPQRK